MGTGRTLNKAPRTRPKKKPCARRRREKNQRERLVALGMDEGIVARLTSRKLRELLRRPARIAG